MPEYRVLSRIVGDICEKLGIELSMFSGDWVMRLKKGERAMFVCGYQFPLNDAAAEGICADKAACFAVLNDSGIAAVEHSFFMSPSNIHYSGENGNWAEMTALLEKFRRVVVKNNYGTGGANIYIAQTRPELEKAVSDVFRVSRGLSISPYLDIDDEYRTIWCVGEPMLCYRKLRPSVTGDGLRSIAELAAAAFGVLPSEPDSRLDPRRIPEKGETVFLTWKHNLGRGASAEILTDDAMREKVTYLASRAARTLNVNFASIDIVRLGDELRVLEVNSGIMTEAFASQSRENYLTALSIYERAIRHYFAI